MNRENVDRKEFQEKLLKLENLKKNRRCELSEGPMWGVWSSVTEEGEDQRKMYWIRPSVDDEKIALEMSDLFTEITGLQSGVIKVEDYVK